MGKEAFGVDSGVGIGSGGRREEAFGVDEVEKVRYPFVMGWLGCRRFGAK
jgi:hypothetical protein